MARPLRIEYPGAWYQVMNRGGDGISSLTSSLTPTINVTTFLLYWVRCIPVTGRRFMPMVRWAITTTYSHVRGQSPAGYASCEWVVYPILLSHRGQRRDIISWALQGHPRRCRHPLARTISLYSSQSLGSPNHQAYRVTPVPGPRYATLGDDWQMTRS